MSVVVVSAPSGDWEGLFLNGKLAVEGHNLPWYVVLDALGFQYERREADDVWMSEMGEFPVDISDVKMEDGRWGISE